MKKDSVKIIQMVVEPYTYYTSNGSPYKDKTETYKVFGLGENGVVYEWGEHYIGEKAPWKKEEGWKKYLPR